MSIKKWDPQAGVPQADQWPYYLETSPEIAWVADNLPELIRHLEGGEDYPLIDPGEIAEAEAASDEPSLNATETRVAENLDKRIDIATRTGKMVQISLSISLALDGAYDNEATDEATMDALAGAWLDQPLTDGQIWVHPVPLVQNALIYAPYTDVPVPDLDASNMLLIDPYTDLTLLKTGSEIGAWIFATANETETEVAPGH